MRRLLLAGVTLLFGSWQSSAQDRDPWNDYALLFADHAGDLVERSGPDGETTRVLVLPNGVSVTQTGPVGGETYLASDIGSRGAAACYLWHAYFLGLIAEICDVAATDAERETLRERLAIATNYVAANAYPVRTNAEVLQLLDGAANFEAAQHCELVTKSPASWQRLLDAVLSKQAMDELELGMVAPRLPVTGPDCL